MAMSSYRIMSNYLLYAPRHSEDKGKNRILGSVVSKEIVSAGQLVAGAGMAITTAVTTNNFNSMASNIFPGLAVGQGFISIIRGIYALLDKEYCKEIPCPYLINNKHIPLWGDWAPAINRARGAVDILSGAYLLEGGIEAFANSWFNTNFSLGLGSLYLRFAIYSGSQFILAMSDFITYYGVDKDIRKKEKGDWDPYWYTTVHTLISTGLMAAGWVMLCTAQAAVDVVSNPAAVSRVVIGSCLAFAASAIVLINTYLPKAKLVIHDPRLKTSAESPPPLQPFGSADDLNRQEGQSVTSRAIPACSPVSGKEDYEGDEQCDAEKGLVHCQQAAPYSRHISVSEGGIVGGGYSSSHDAPFLPSPTGLGFGSWSSSSHPGMFPYAFSSGASAFPSAAGVNMGGSLSPVSSPPSSHFAPRSIL